MTTKQKRSDRILENASKLEEVRDVARKILGEGVDADLIHLIHENMKMNDEMDAGMLEKDLINASSLSEQLYGEEGKRIETIVGVYAIVTAKPLDDDDDD